MQEIKLNPSQQKAVNHKKGPLLIIAGAGTGKTWVITQRIVNLVNSKQAKPEEILALTFTQKAAQEMEERVDIAMPYGYTEVQISTFHSFCDKILRQEAIYIGLDSGYTLMSNAQEYMYFRSKLFDLNLDRFRPHGNPTKFIYEILKHFSRLGDEDVNPEEYEKFIKNAKDLETDQQDDYKELAQVYKQYKEFKQKDSKVGFSDLVPYVLKLFRDRPAVLKRYKSQFKYILVDEFQDTNYAQNELLKLLAGKTGNITVVGDDDQAIYKFRGAAISNILDFKKSFPSYKKVVLTKNYRNCQKILDKSYRLITNNDPYRLEVTEGIDKKLKSVVSEISESNLKSQKSPKNQLNFSLSAPESCVKDPVRRIHQRSELDEAEAVVSEVKKLTKGKNKRYNLSDIAILVRANNHSESFVTALKRNGIKFTFPGPKGLFSRPEIKDLLAFLKVISDYRDNVSMYRILTQESSVLSPREFVDLQILARKRRISTFELIEELTGIKVGKARKKGKNRVPNNLPKLEANKILSKKSVGWIKKLMTNFSEAFEQVRHLKPVGEVLYEIVTKSGYLDNLVSNESTKNEWRILNIGKFFDLIKEFQHESEMPTVSEFLDYMDYSLEIGESPRIDPFDMIEQDAVNIYTVHGAKGLEFPVVFMVNLVSDRFPTRRRSDVLPIPDGLIKEVLPEGDEHIQEERRLFYVGMTRAKELLYLTSAEYYGDGIRKKRQSLFLYDLTLEKVEPEEQVKDVKTKLKEFEMSESELEVPPDVRNSKIDYITRNLSYSQVSSFSNCPYQFYLNYILGIPGGESFARSFGLTMHNTLREFYERQRQYNDGLPGVTKKPGLDELLEIYESKWQSAGYESKQQEHQRYKSGLDSLKKYFKELHTGKEKPVMLEKKFRVNLGDFWMVGTVDRVDEVEGGLHIIDYKTGNVPKDVEKYGKDIQPAIYVLSMEKLQDKPVKRASLLYIESQKLVDVGVDDKLKERATSEITKILGEIKEGKFIANAGRLCKFCDYRNVCDYAVVV